mmetsp:Transcript_10737/g.10381  ORF Transcript_10737/g.10381 Transcript_10737/m.10381 type:complete len:80 (+) Transcript_10737:183-422(+)
MHDLDPRISRTKFLCIRKNIPIPDPQLLACRVHSPIPGGVASFLDPPPRMPACSTCPHTKHKAGSSIDTPGRESGNVMV